MKRQNLRTVSLIVVTFTYLLFGAAIFGYLESEHELRQRETLELLELIVRRKYNISDDDFTVLTTTVIRSVPHKAGIQWKFPGAFYFATTVVTTIGYGHSTPATVAGRSFCMIYALIGIPLGLVMFQSIGERLNTFVGSALSYAKRCLNARNPEVTQTNLVMVVSVLSTILMTSMAAVFAKYERWDYFDALYYCFITLTTIGFGDYVALQKESALQSKPEYVALSLIFILFGLSVVSSAVNLLVLKFLTLNTEDERRDEQLRYTANLNPIQLEGDVITSASGALQYAAPKRPPLQSLRRHRRTSTGRHSPLAERQCQWHSPTSGADCDHKSAAEQRLALHSDLSCDVSREFGLESSQSPSADQWERRWLHCAHLHPQLTAYCKPVRPRPLVAPTDAELLPGAPTTGARPAPSSADDWTLSDDETFSQQPPVTETRRADARRRLAPAGPRDRRHAHRPLARRPRGPPTACECPACNAAALELALSQVGDDHPSSCSCSRLSLYSAGAQAPAAPMLRRHQPLRPISSSSSQAAPRRQHHHPAPPLLVLGAAGLMRQHSSQLIGWPPASQPGKSPPDSRRRKSARDPDAYTRRSRHQQPSANSSPIGLRRSWSQASLGPEPRGVEQSPAPRNAHNHHLSPGSSSRRRAAANQLDRRPTPNDLRPRQARGDRQCERRDESALVSAPIGLNVSATSKTRALGSSTSLAPLVPRDSIGRSLQQRASVPNVQLDTDPTTGPQNKVRQNTRGRCDLDPSFRLPRDACSDAHLDQPNNKQAYRGSVTKLVCKCCCQHLECIQYALQARSGGMSRRMSSTSSASRSAEFAADWSDLERRRDGWTTRGRSVRTRAAETRHSHDDRARVFSMQTGSDDRASQPSPSQQR